MAAKKHSPGFEKLCEDARTRIREVSVRDAAREAGTPGVLLVDVREESEWAAGHAAGAIHLGKGIIERDVEERVPDPSTRLLLYCGGGWRAWNEAGLPVTRA